MMAGVSATEAMAATGGVVATRRHLVHVYTVIRIKVEVDAPDHRSAMEAADMILFGNGLSVALRPVASAVLEAEHADEITGYLVDEADDEGFDRSRGYGPDHAPDRPPVKEGAK